jgi:hypothetical protein
LLTFSHSTQTMCAGGSVRGLLHSAVATVCAGLKLKEMLCVRGYIHSAAATVCVGGSLDTPCCFNRRRCCVCVGIFTLVLPLEMLCVRGYIHSAVATEDAVCAWLYSLWCCHWRCCVCVAIFTLLLPLKMLCVRGYIHSAVATGDAVCVRGCITLAMHFHHADVLRTQILELRSPSDPAVRAFSCSCDQRV